MSNKLIGLLVVVGVIIAALTAVSIMTVDITTVHGNEIGVLETWQDGVVDEPKIPKTYILIPGFMKEIYIYDVSSQVFVMNDTAEQIARGRRQDSYLVQSAEGQDMRISLNVQWRIDPKNVIHIHKTVRRDIEEKILRPGIMRIVKDSATTRIAIEAYSGVGLVKLQSEIFDRMVAPDGELRSRGVIVENFVIEGIGLDREYVGEIKAKQVAIQRELRAREETKAAESEALRARADAQKDYEKQVVEARRDKEVGVLNFEMKAEQEVLQATADATKVVLAAEAASKKVELAARAQKKQTVLAAEGEKEAGELRAKAILAIGEAEAQATKLKLSAYAVEGADAFIKIEVAKQMAAGFKNIRGYLPQDMKINLLSESFLDAVRQATSPADTSNPTTGQ